MGDISLPSKRVFGLSCEIRSEFLEEGSMSCAWVISDSRVEL